LDSEAIRQVYEEIAGGSFADCFARYVYGTDKIFFEDYFALAGNRLVVDEQPTRVRDSTGFLGIGTQVQEDRVRVTEVVRGSPAWEYGLNYGDDILAINGAPVTSYGSFVGVLRHQRPGDVVEIEV
jgi:predicted metalloprotease with PDZ domain